MASRDVFISWSGEQAKAVAKALKDWLEHQYDVLNVFVSDVSIEAGQRGMDQIKDAIQDAKIAVVVVTSESVNSAWVNFEAGAIGGMPGPDGLPRKVVPVLVDLASPTDLTGPLVQYQAVPLDRDGMLRMLESINTAIGMAPEKAGQKLSSGWESLHESLDAAREATPKRASLFKSKQRSERELLEEILQLVRGQGRQPYEDLRSDIDRKSMLDRIETLALKYGLREHLEDLSFDDDHLAIELNKEAPGINVAEFVDALRREIPPNYRAATTVAGKKVTSN